MLLSLIASLPELIARDAYDYCNTERFLRPLALLFCIDSFVPEKRALVLQVEALTQPEHCGELCGVHLQLRPLSSPTVLGDFSQPKRGLFRHQGRTSSSLPSLTISGATRRLSRWADV